MSKFFCPECQKAGLKSTVTFLGGRHTLMGHTPYYDEEGDYHSHDPNKITSEYQCSHGHRWEVSTGHRCQCGWKSSYCHE